MKRTRPLALAAGVATLLALSACSGAARTAATVDGQSVPAEEFESDLTAVGKVLNTETAGGTEDGGLARTLLQIRITSLLQSDLLEQDGLAVEQADRDNARTTLDGQLGGQLAALPEATQERLVGDFAVQTAYQRLIQPPADLEAAYAEDPASTGALCLSHILLATEAEAQDVVAQLEDGADFATLAQERSTDTASGARGGALTDTDGSPCSAYGTLIQNFDADFMAGATTAAPGSFTQPVESQFGWHVIKALPWADVAEDIAADSATDLGRVSAGYRRLQLASEDADVDVNSKFGTWNAVQLSVDPTTGPAPSGG